MKVLIGAIAYLSVVTAVILAAVVGLSSIERRQPGDPTPVLASSTDNEGGQRAVDDAKADTDRVPVWIVPTAKYVYTPVPVDPKPKRSAVIGVEARDAMARERSRADGQGHERALGDAAGESGRALGFTRSRDNDPFFRD